MSPSPVFNASPGAVHGSTQTKSFPATVQITHRRNSGDADTTTRLPSARTSVASSRPWSSRCRSTSAAVRSMGPSILTIDFVLLSQARVAAVGTELRAFSPSATAKYGWKPIPKGIAVAERFSTRCSIRSLAPSSA